MCIPVPDMEDKIQVRDRPRGEGQWITYYHHYHAEIFIAVIDLIATEMNSRFNETNTELLPCCYALIQETHSPDSIIVG